MDLKGKRVLIVGLAQTGVAVARFCANRGADVTVTDAKPADRLRAAVEALAGCADLDLGGHTLEKFTGADLIVMSPGVPELAQTRTARAAGVEVIAEIELAYRFLDPDAALVAITGTNGKSTTTALAGTLCAATGRPTFCGGNLGNYPLIDAVDHPANQPGGFVVAEVAGFMLETCTSFRPRVAACLNVTDDHLDRYGLLSIYASMKTRIFRWQEDDDFAIANAHCPLTAAGAGAARSQMYLFSSAGEVECGAFVDHERQELVLRLRGAPEERYPTSDLRLIGTHNLENAMAAYLAARLAGVAPEEIQAGATAFRPRKHRMELCAELDDVQFFDDSKGTNVAAVAASVAGFPRPVVLIAGGVDKGGSYQAMFDAFAPVARALVLIGAAAPLIRSAAQANDVSYPVVEADSMDEAVAKAAGLARAGDAVVLSPACSSYDMFRNFEDRGMAFRDAASAVGARRLDLANPGPDTTD